MTVLTRSLSSCPFCCLAGDNGSLLAGAGAGEAVFAASASALSAALTTWVARAAFSRGERLVGVGESHLPRREGARVFVLARDREFEVLDEGRESESLLIVALLLMSRRRVLRSDDVAGEHVVTEVTALRTASACAWSESMTVTSGVAVAVAGVVDEVGSENVACGPRKRAKKVRADP